MKKLFCLCLLTVVMSCLYFVTISIVLDTIDFKEVPSYINYVFLSIYVILFLSTLLNRNVKTKQIKFKSGYNILSLEKFNELKLSNTLYTVKYDSKMSDIYIVDDANNLFYNIKYIGIINNSYECYEFYDGLKNRIGELRNFVYGNVSHFTICINANKSFKVDLETGGGNDFSVEHINYSIQGKGDNYNIIRGGYKIADVTGDNFNVYDKAVIEDMSSCVVSMILAKYFYKG